MILNAIIHNEYHHAETWQEMSAVIDEIMTNLRYETFNNPWTDPGETVCLMFDKAPFTGKPAPWPDNTLCVSVNASTGYGGLTWYVEDERAAREQSDITEHIWVSDNPNPPAFDPRVVSESHYPLFYDPRCTLPAALIRSALEEFCRTGTGDRPTCVDWTRGHINGQLLDAVW
ncbi:Imm1 family immunity protein [Streptomyces yaizuensis]|uniref:Imm1 family immunity protein n=1 Tax=Streptomyces yaizuensis TaxID=2989713 RepID=A0ABQ5NXT6_9ACTN|nr:Imm1 family immunity protein [Streptomyces sp. YSPA8]GLF95179.1 Imm1 family immunity protein [Streptomyces sp. YSPA8]